MFQSLNGLSFENQKNYDELLMYLMNYALDHDIGIKWTHKLPAYAPPASFDRPGKLIVMNSKWPNAMDFPFQLSHEIGHVLHESSQYYNLNHITHNRGEALANRFAIELLQQYCQDNDYHYSNWYSFAKAFNIPTDLFYLFSTAEYKVQPCCMEY